MAFYKTFIHAIKPPGACNSLEVPAETASLGHQAVPALGPWPAGLRTSEKMAQRALPELLTQRRLPHGSLLMSGRAEWYRREKEYSLASLNHRDAL